MQPLNVQTLFKDPKEAPQLFSMKMKPSQWTSIALRDYRVLGKTLRNIVTFAMHVLGSAKHIQSIKETPIMACTNYQKFGVADYDKVLDISMYIWLYNYFH